MELSNKKETYQIYNVSTLKLFGGLVISYESSQIELLSGYFIDDKNRLSGNFEYSISSGICLSNYSEDLKNDMETLLYDTILLLEIQFPTIRWR